MTEQDLSKELLARIDERTKNLQDDIRKQSEEYKTSHKAIMDLISTDYVKKTEFDPIKKLVYGFVGFVLLAVLTASGSIIFKNTTAIATPTTQVTK